MVLTSFKIEALIKQFPFLKPWTLTLEKAKTFKVERMDEHLLDQSDTGLPEKDWAQHFVVEDVFGPIRTAPSTYYTGPYNRFFFLNSAGEIIRQPKEKPVTEKIKRRFLFWTWIEEFTPRPKPVDKSGSLRTRLRKIGDSATDLCCILEFGGQVMHLGGEKNCTLHESYVRLYKLPKGCEEAAKLLSFLQQRADQEIQKELEQM